MPPVANPPDRTHGRQSTRTEPHVVGEQTPLARALERPMMPFSGIELASGILPIVAAVVGGPVLSGTRPVWPEGVPVAMASDGLLVEGA